jgi:alpha-L-fucosidase
MDVDLRHLRPVRAVSLAAALLSVALVTSAVTALALGAPRAGAIAVAAPGNAASSYTPSASNFEAREWFQDARFGIFLHWGLYSELGGVGTPGLSEWIMNDARISAAKYERLASFFNPVHFDADAWVRQFKAAGARYIVITSKHHDGFAMFKTTVSSYNVVDATPFKRDPLAELAAACQRQGIKLFFYYSQLDWHHPDYFPRGATGQFAGRAPAGDFARYVEYQNAQIRELVTQYGAIGGIWFDGWWDQKGTALQNAWDLERTYKIIHDAQPAALIVNNHHQNPFPGEDYQTFERDLPGENAMGFNGAQVARLPLEMSETMNGTWGFSLIDTNYKSARTLVTTLVAAAGRGANFLLNTGPMPNGEIQGENLKTLAEIGNWLRANGESIYGTRAGPVTPRPWGVTTQSSGHIYVHVLDWHDPILSLPLHDSVRSARRLGGGSVGLRRTAAGIELTLPQTGEWDRIIVLQK